MENSFEHLVQFYKNENYLTAYIADYFKAGLVAGDSCIMIATPAHREAVAHLLKSRGVDIDSHELDGKFVSLDAAATLVHFMHNNMPDAQSFSEIIGNRVPVLGRRVRAFGEMVALLWQDGNSEGAIALEKLWNDLGKIRKFSLLCAYPEHIIANGLVADSSVPERSITNFYALEPFRKICSEHSEVIPELIA